MPMIYEHVMTGGLVMGGAAQVEYRRMPKKHGKYAYQSKEGRFARADGTGNVDVVQIIDRTLTPPRYRKLVRDADTGEVLRDVDEPLADHQGRGSARGR